MRRTQVVWLLRPGSRDDGRYAVAYCHPGSPDYGPILYKAKSRADAERWRREQPTPEGDRP